MNTIGFLFISILTTSLAQDYCSPPFKRIGDGCYFYDETLYIDSYPATIDFCASIGGYPVVVKHGEENRWLMDHLLPDNILGDAVILGATRRDDDLFEWFTGGLVRDTFDNWYPGDDGDNANEQPNGSGDCMAWSVEYNMYWDDIPCGDFNGTFSQVSFICEDDVIVSTDPPPTGSTTSGPSTPPSTTTDNGPNNYCPEPFVDLGIGCYYASPEQRESWFSARYACESIGGYLAVLTSAEEQAIVGSWLDTEYPEPRKDDVWIGAYDKDVNDVYQWINGESFVYTNWANGEPDQGNNNHVYLSDSEGWKWGDEMWDIEQYYLCEAEGGSGTTTAPTTTSIPSTTTSSSPVDCVEPFVDLGIGCYYASPEQRESWFSGRYACESMGGYLAVLTSSEEQRIIAEWLDTVYPEPIDDVWIGAYDKDVNDVYQWINGEPFVYTNWATGEPDQGNNNHVYLSDSEGWKWGDEMWDIEHFYLCESDGGSGTTTTPLPTTTTAFVCPSPFVEVADGCYFASTEDQSSWIESEITCESYGGNLAAITSEDQQQKLEEYLSETYPAPTAGVWIGGFDRDGNDVFYWVTGEPVTYENWADGEPDSSDEDFMYLSESDGWAWANEVINVNQFYLCQLRV